MALNLNTPINRLSESIEALFWHAQMRLLFGIRPTSPPDVGDVVHSLITRLPYLGKRVFHYLYEKRLDLCEFFAGNRYGCHWPEYCRTA